MKFIKLANTQEKAGKTNTKAYQSDDLGTWKDSQGNLWSGSKVFDPNSQRERVQWNPMSDVGEGITRPQGGMSKVSGVGTGEEKAAWKAQEQLSKHRLKIMEEQEKSGIEQTEAGIVGDIEDLYKNISPAMREVGTQASKDVTRFEIMENILPASHTGKLAEFKVEAKKFANEMGWAKFDVSDAETFRVLSLSFVMSHINDTKGSISDKEMETFIKASPGLLNSEKGNAKIIKIGKATAQYQKKLASEYSRWIKENKSKRVGASDWEVHKQEWNKENQLKLSDYGLKVAEGGILVDADEQPKEKYAGFKIKEVK